MIGVKALYGVLRDVAASKGVVSYEDLARLYHEAVGDWHEPQAALWQVPLVEINGLARAAGLPPLSALVTDKPRRDEGFGPPASGFWGSPGVPARPSKADDRLMIWMGFVNLVHLAAWPEALAGPP